MKNFLLPILLLTAMSFSAQTWKQLGQDIDGEAPGDFSGRVDISKDGLTVVTGAYRNDGNGSNSGHLRVYKYIAGIWTQLGSDIDGDVTNDEFGGRVSCNSDGSIVASGAPGNDGNGSNSGHARVYKFITGVWTQIGQDIDGEAIGDASGSSVTVSADSLVICVGAKLNDGNGPDAGHVRVYRYNGANWIQMGQDIDGEAAGDWLGERTSLSSDGLTLLTGGRYNDGNGSNSGHARVYKFITGVWTQIGQDIDGEAINDESGNAVAISSDGLTVAIGAPFNDGNGIDAGHVRVYQYSGVNWIQIGQDIDGEAAGDRSGWNVDLSSDGLNVIIGAQLADGVNGTNSGHQRVYQYSGSSWTQIGQDVDGEASNDNSLPNGLSSDGKVLVMGALGNDGIGSAAGHARIFTLCQPSLGIINQTICAGDSIVVNGTIYNTTVTGATETFLNSVGPVSNCDSIVTINLTVLPVMASTINQTICAGQSIVVNGNTYNTTTTGGIEVVTNVGPFSCDSAITINLTVLPVKTGAINQIICGTDSIIVNGTTYNSTILTGTEVITGVGPASCDSTVTINLTPGSTVDTSVTNNSPILTANQLVAAYQWLDCNNGMALIPTEINQSFTATVNGSYAVQITVGGCTDTSACVNMIVTNISSINELFNLNIYPSPASDEITIEGIDKLYNIFITDALGRLMYSEKDASEGSKTLNIGSYNRGIYFVRIEVDGDVFTKKIVKR